jgi:hypothetical protein
MSERSILEAGATPMSAARAAQVLKSPAWHLSHHRPGEGDPAQPGGPVNWRDMEDDEYDETWGALSDFLHWALPRWGFTTEQIPHACWWQHPDIVEELTAWWGLWQAYIRNPTAPIASQMEFQVQTFQLKLRLEHAYRGRCRHEHQPASQLVIRAPE